MLPDKEETKEARRAALVIIMALWRGKPPCGLTALRFLRDYSALSSFYLAIAILQFFSLFFTASPGRVILPFLIVLAITAIKDGYEHYKRHQSDRAVNYSQVRVLAGGDWANLNPMEGKSKTFVHGFVPEFTRRPSTRRAKMKQIHAKFQSETSVHGAPPDAVVSEAARRAEEGRAQPEAEWDGIEYPDETPVEEPSTGGLQHHEHPHCGWTRAHWRIASGEDVKVGDYVKIMDND